MWPRSQAPMLGNANIEVVQAIHIRVPGEPGNEARLDACQSGQISSHIPYTTCYQLRTTTFFRQKLQKQIKSVLATTAGKSSITKSILAMYCNNFQAKVLETKSVLATYCNNFQAKVLETKSVLATTTTFFRQKFQKQNQKIQNEIQKCTQNLFSHIRNCSRV